MISSYAQKYSVVQNVAGSKVSSVFDKSLQSEALQRKADMANNAAQREEAPRPNNTGMPDNLKSGIESLSGFSMDDVRVHYNSNKPATVQALAYTQGTDIHVAPGQEKHLPHEAWHVAQQMAGRVSPTTNINGMPVNDNAGLEHEADVMGEKAAQCKENSFFKSHLNNSNNTIQCGGALSRPKEPDIHDDIHYQELSNRILTMKDEIEGIDNITIKDCFFTKENIDALIRKTFKNSPGGGDSELKNGLKTYENINDKIKNRIFDTMKISITETLKDIQFWVGNKTVNNIELTDSDMHTRGVGVCIVTYVNDQNIPETCVIKPEDKSLEKLIYGKNDPSSSERSLAEIFGNIGTLKIDVSAEHGSKVEYVKHERNKRIPSGVSLDGFTHDKMKPLIHFSSILGLSDLHQENFVYLTDLSPQLIDAEIALWTRLNNLASVIFDGGASRAMPSPSDGSLYLSKEIQENLKSAIIPELFKYKEFLGTVQNKFTGQKSRIVPIGTPSFYQARDCLYKTDPLPSTLMDELRTGLRFGGGDTFYTDEETIKNTLSEILLSGKIPFFEYIYDEGEIVLKKLNTSETDLTIYKKDNLKLPNVIAERQTFITEMIRKAPHHPLCDIIPFAEFDA